MKTLTKILAITALYTGTTPALAQTTMPLNTGYNHSSFSVYGNPLQPSTTNDNYWIREIAYFNNTSAPQATAFVIQQASPWAPPMGSSRWIGGHNTNLAPAGSGTNNPSYAIFKKCFCLMPGFRDARLNFRIRADDKVNVWFQTMTNVLLAPTLGNFSPTAVPHSGGTDRNFKVGKNCIYVLVEDDQGGHTGFNLEGSVTAQGLMPQPAAGTAQSFAPCACNGVGPVGAAGQARANIEERAVVAQITRFAEARRIEAVRRLTSGSIQIAPVQ